MLDVRQIDHLKSHVTELKMKHRARVQATAGISSLYAMIALGGAGVVVVGLTAKTVQQQKEHTALVQKMRRHQQSEMVAPPTLV